MCKAPWPRPICSYAAHPVSLLYTCQTNVARYPCSRLLMKASAAERLFPHAICTSSIMRTQKRFSSSRPSASSREGKLSQCKHSTLVIDAIKSRERPCRGPRHGQGCGCGHRQADGDRCCHKPVTNQVGGGAANAVNTGSRAVNTADALR